MTIAEMAAGSLKQRWNNLLTMNPALRIRNAAEQLQVSEAELLATRTGAGVIRLEGDFKRLMTEIEPLGEVMALTRNDAVVHEKTGQYQNLSIHGTMGLALGVIDLRLFFNRFVSAFAVEEETEHGSRRSLQFFNAQGEAVHKIYAREATDMAAFDALVNRYRAADQHKPLTLEAAAGDNLLTMPADVDVSQLRQDWSALKDVHHFQAMLNKYGLQRIPAYRLVGAEYAQRLDIQAFEQALTLAADSELPVMIFAGSDGVIQIHTGTVKKLLRTGPWFNVLDPGFNLHANTELIDQVWLVRKPTSDGIVSSLEMFDAEGRQLALMFGERHNGEAELEGWRRLLAKLLGQFVLEAN